MTRIVLSRDASISIIVFATLAAIAGIDLVVLSLSGEDLISQGIHLAHQRGGAVLQNTVSLNPSSTAAEVTPRVLYGVLGVCTIIVLAIAASGFCDNRGANNNTLTRFASPEQAPYHGSQQNFW